MRDSIRLEGNMDINLREIGFEGVNLIKGRFLWLKFVNEIKNFDLSQWPRGLRCRSAVARLLSLWVRIPPGAWMSVCCECCVFSSRDL